MATPYAKHLDYFGSPEAYATEIRRKESAGESFFDPSAAASFKADNPTMFSYKNPYETEVRDILSQLRKSSKQSANLQNDPYYKAQMQLAEQQGQQAGQQAMETLNTRGILNSTITADRVAQAQQQARATMLPTAIQGAQSARQAETGNLLNLLNAYGGLDQQAYERDQAMRNQAIAKTQQQLKSAMDRVSMLGYVDNESSVALGIPVGTPSFEAKRAADQLQQQLEIAKMSAQTQLQVANTYRSGGGGGGGTAVSNATADAVSLLEEAYANGYNEDQIDELIANATETWTRDRVSFASIDRARKILQAKNETRMAQQERANADAAWADYLQRQEEYNALPWYERMRTDDPYNTRPGR